MIKEYIRQILAIARRSSWTAANGLAGTGIVGVALIRPGVQNLFSTDFRWATALNWLLSFIIYAILAWIILFIFQLVFIAPYRLWKRERNERAINDAASEPAREQQIVVHDRRLAARMRDIFPEASKIKLVSDLLHQHGYWDTQANQLSDVAHFLDSAEAHFLIDELRKLATEFGTASAELLKFMGLSFFVHPRDRRERPTFFAMQPSWNLDREGNGSEEQIRKYDELTRKLEGLVGTFAQAYDKLIKEFHRTLLE